MLLNFRNRYLTMTPLTKAKALVEDNCFELPLKLLAKKTGLSYGVTKQYHQQNLNLEKSSYMRIMYLAAVYDKLEREAKQHAAR